MIDYRTLLVPYDFSEHAAAALARALDLQVRFDADLHLLYVIHTPVYVATGHDSAPFPLPPSEKEDLWRSLRQVAMAASNGATRPIESRVVDGMNVADTIRVVAEELDAGLIIMGTHGHSGLVHMLLGSVAEQTLRRAPCPVMTVRAGSGDGSATATVSADTSRAAASPASPPGLETMTAAIERLARAGFDESFQARAGKLFALKGAQIYDPEDLLVREIVRFEGESDPGDSTVLFAIRSFDGSICGTFVAGYGAAADPESAAVVSRLGADHSAETRGREHLRSGRAPVLESRSNPTASGLGDLDPTAMTVP